MAWTWGQGVVPGVRAGWAPQPCPGSRRRCPYLVGGVAVPNDELAVLGGADQQPGQQKTNTVHNHLYVESRKLRQMSEYNKTEADLENKLVVQWEDGREEGQDRGRGLRGTSYYA